MENIKLGKVEIGENCKPFIIAEMSGNHNQSLQRALDIVKAAAEAGAHALKLQTYTPDTMTVKGALTINDSNSLWNGKELYELYNEAFTPWEWHKKIFDYAKELGMIAFSTPFDETAVDFLEELGVEIYKIASFENTDWPLLKKVAQTGKPVIMSIGAANLSDIDEAVRILRNNGCKELVLLKCTSTYPSTPENTNILTIPHMKKLFNCHVGLSDHTLGIGVAIGAVALGACVVEKHFTLRREDGGVDSVFSIEPEELRNLVIESEKAFLSLGSVYYGVLKAEEKNLTFKRSIYCVQDINKGDLFSKSNVKVLRPGNGLLPKYYEIVLGKIASQNIKAGTPISWDYI